MEFWYSVIVQCYAYMVRFAYEVHSHWAPVPYSGRSTVGLKTTVYNGQTRTIYSDGTTAIMIKGMPATIYLPATTVYLPTTQTVLDIIGHEATPEGAVPGSPWMVR